MKLKESYDMIDIFVYLWKKRKILLGITLIGAVISIVASLMIPNYYKAQAVIFPTNFLSPQTNILQRNTNQEMDPMLIGDEDDLEKTIQILHSDYIFNTIVKKYNLAEHYGLSPDDKHFMNKLQKTFYGNITFKKTQYQAAVISVVDIDPKIAASIANDICDLVDTVVFQIQKERSLKVYEGSKLAFDEAQKEYLTYKDSLQKLNERGLYAYYQQVERLTQAYAEGYANNTISARGEKFFDKEFDTFSKYASNLLEVQDRLTELTKNMEIFRKSMLQAKTSLENPLPHKYIVTKASVPDKKAYPKRSFIVIFSTIGAFVFAVALILFLDFYKEFRNRIKEEK